MAEVLIARSQGIEGFERHVVVKRILGDNAKNEHFVKMFVDEARLAAAIHHHNVVQVHDIGTERGEYFFTMEYVHGEDLRAILFHAAQTKTRVPLEHVVTIISAAAAGLHHAHELRGPDRKPLNIVHRDVSPANILVGYDGGVKVADFGIAKAAMRTTETQSGVLKGKVAYMSPEQCLGEAIDRRSDIFGLGIVLYELATVRRLFKGTNDFITMSMISGAPIPLPSTKWPEIPPGLEAIIMKALARDPAERYQTALEMRGALEQFAKQASLGASTSALGDWLVQHLGERPLPWEVESTAPPEKVGVDFDGSASGVAEAVPDMIVGRPSSPIVRARTRTKSQAHPFGKAVATPESEPASVSPPPDDDVVAAPRRRPIGVWIGAAMAALVVIVLVIAKVGGGSSDAAAPLDATTAAVAPDPPPPPPPVPVPVAPPVVAPAQGSGSDAVPAQGSGSDAGSGSAAHSQPKPVVHKKPIDPAKKKWDPNALFPQ